MWNWEFKRSLRAGKRTAFEGVCPPDYVSAACGEIYFISRFARVSTPERLFGALQSK